MGLANAASRKVWTCDDFCMHVHCLVFRSEPQLPLRKDFGIPEWANFQSFL